MKYVLLLLFFSSSLCAAEPVFRLNKVTSVQQKTLSKVQFIFDTFADTTMTQDSTVASNLMSNTGVLSGDILVYPSPCPNFNCELGFRVINGTMNDLKLQIHDMRGSKLIDYSFNANSGYNKIDLSELISYQPGTGMYYVLLLDENSEILEKTKFSALTKGGS